MSTIASPINTTTAAKLIAALCALAISMVVSTDLALAGSPNASKSPVHTVQLTSSPQGKAKTVVLPTGSSARRPTAALKKIRSTETLQKNWGLPRVVLRWGPYQTACNIWVASTIVGYIGWFWRATGHPPTPAQIYYVSSGNC